MIFPILTEKEIQTQDEMTLRHRVRELSTAISQLADIASSMRELYTVLRGTHVTIHEISRDLKILLHRAPEPKQRKTASRKTASRKTASRKTKKRKR